MLHLLKRTLSPAWMLILLLALPGLSGCGQAGAPQPLAPEQAPAELATAFAKAKPELKEVASKAGEALHAKRYPEASMLLMELTREPGLDAQARAAVTRAMLGVNQAMQEAQSQGDAQSAEYLRQLQKSK